MPDTITDRFDRSTLVERPVYTSVAELLAGHASRFDRRPDQAQFDLVEPGARHVADVSPV